MVATPSYTNRCSGGDGNRDGSDGNNDGGVGESDGGNGDSDGVSSGDGGSDGRRWWQQWQPTAMAEGHRQ